ATLPAGRVRFAPLPAPAVLGAEAPGAGAADVVEAAADPPGAGSVLAAVGAAGDVPAAV
ncbi:MAG: hypothetical protein QOI75_974, partial [Pseudonocardiales bacterium]|nr:hypothetical protein [Pseudonocardiales bacterium]